MARSIIFLTFHETYDYYDLFYSFFKQHATFYDIYMAHNTFLRQRDTFCELRCEIVTTYFTITKKKRCEKKLLYFHRKTQKHRVSYHLMSPSCSDGVLLLLLFPLILLSSSLSFRLCSSPAATACRAPAWRRIPPARRRC